MALRLHRCATPFRSRSTSLRAVCGTAALPDPDHNFAGGSSSSTSSRASPAPAAGAYNFAVAGCAVATTTFLLAWKAHSPSQCSSASSYEVRPDGTVDRLKRWKSGPWNLPHRMDPGWHIVGPHPLLEKHLPRVLQGLDVSGKDAAEAPAVLLPLCGKSCDLPYLCSEGLRVVGVEGVPRAITEFRQEQRRHTKGLGSSVILSQATDGTWSKSVQFEPSASFEGSRPGFVFKKDKQGVGYYSDSPRVWHGEGHNRMIAATSEKPFITRPLDIIQGDFFDVTPAMVSAATSVEEGQFDLAFDRAGFASIPPCARKEYAAVLKSLIKPGGRLLLIAEDYDQRKVPEDTQGRRMGPPPFAVSEKELASLFPTQDWTVTVLERAPSDLPKGMNPSFRGVAVDEVVYLIRRRSDADKVSKMLIASAAVAAIVAAAAYCQYTLAGKPAS
eukprot:TRINITY_DN42038_c0_g1_i1.p1 TRINITY_DN42038_c0_g1~~TRINITY_DN42038_c0_g1_i1.p1  ORF type:complete len:462 (+),score=71.75 TRINITY_DN42038_c0_g1_i1:58-1386(+)